MDSIIHMHIHAKPFTQSFQPIALFDTTTRVLHIFYNQQKVLWWVLVYLVHDWPLLLQFIDRVCLFSDLLSQRRHEYILECMIVSFLSIALIVKKTKTKFYEPVIENFVTRQRHLVHLHRVVILLSCVLCSCLTLFYCCCRGGSRAAGVCYKDVTTVVHECTQK